MSKPEGFEQSDSDPLPYTQVDRAVKTKAALLAGELQVSTQHALGSLVEFWDLNGDPRELEKLLAKGADEVVISAAEARIRFRLASGKDVDPNVLAALGLLEQRGEDFRVRGMSRYFKPLKARIQSHIKAVAGGKASAEARKKKTGSAQPNRSGAGSESGSEVVRTSVEPDAERSANRSSAGSGVVRTSAEPARTQRSAVSGQRSAASKRVAGEKPPAAQGEQPRLVDVEPTPPKADADPRHAPLVKALVDACPGYAFVGRDAAAVVSLLNKAEKVAPGKAAFEVVLRWRRALASDGYPKVRAIYELDAHWNHFAKAGPATKGALVTSNADWDNRPKSFEEELADGL